MDYTTLIADKNTAGSIASWANYGLAPAAVVLEEAQGLIYQSLRVREMRSDLTALAVTAGQDSVALPTGFLDPIELFDNYNCPLTLLDGADLIRRRGVDGDGALTTGKPGRYALFGEKVQFDCALDEAVTYQAFFFKAPDLLSSGNTTNFLTRRYPILLRTACMAIVADFRKHDGDYARNVQRLQSLMADIAAKDDLANSGMVVDADYSRIRA